MTPRQLKTLHTFYSRLKKRRPAEFDDGWFRLALRNAGGVVPDADGHVSSKALTNRGMEDVMAVIEETLEKSGDTPGTYWRDTISRRLGYATRPQVHAIRELAAQQRYSLDGLCKRFSQGHADTPDKLTPRQAHALMEALKTIIARGPTEAA